MNPTAYSFHSFPFSDMEGCDADLKGCSIMQSKLNAGAEMGTHQILHTGTMPTSFALMTNQL